MSTDFDFDGFISYSRRRDARAAAWLQGALEHFLPDQSLKPLSLCRDGNNFNIVRAHGDVYALLEAYLTRASKLVVLCSLETPSSIYIDFEIRWFLERGRSHDIVLCITDPIDAKTGGCNVFPSAAIANGLEQRPYFDLTGLRRWSFFPSRRRRAAEEQVAQLAANLLDRSWGEIEPSFAREAAIRRRRLAQVWSAAGALGIALVTIALWQWQSAMQARNEQLVEMRTTGLIASAKWLLEPKETPYGIVIDAWRFLQGALAARNAAEFRPGTAQDVVAIAASHLPLPPVEVPIGDLPSPDPLKRQDTEGRWTGNCDYFTGNDLWHSPDDSYAVTMRSSSEPIILIKTDNGCDSKNIPYTGADFISRVAFSPTYDYFAIIGEQGNYCCGTAISVYRYSAYGPTESLTMFPIPAPSNDRQYALGPKGVLAIADDGAIITYQREEQNGQIIATYLFDGHGEEIELLGFSSIGQVLARTTGTVRGLAFDLTTVMELPNPTTFTFSGCIEMAEFQQEARRVLVRYRAWPCHKQEFDEDPPLFAVIDLQTFVQEQLGAATPRLDEPGARGSSSSALSALEIKIDNTGDIIVNDERTGTRLAVFQTSSQQFTKRPEATVSTDQRWVAVYWEVRTPSGSWDSLLLYDVTGRKALERLCAKLPEALPTRLSERLIEMRGEELNAQTCPGTGNLG